MEENKLEKKEKSFASINLKSFLSVVIILVVMLGICGILSLIIPQGAFARNDSGEIIAGTFVQGDIKGIEFWRIITAPFRVFFADSSLTIIMICLFLLVMSGVFNLLDKTNGLKIIMNKLVAKFNNKKILVICITVLFFMLFGSLFGLFEELVALLPFVIIFMLSMGFDTMMGLGVCMLAACFGFSAAITNPFSVGIASNFAVVSTTDGIWLRIIFFIIIYAVVCLFLCLYAKKISKNPQKSLTYQNDILEKQKIQTSNQNDSNNIKTFKVFTIFFVIQIIVLLLVASIRPISDFAIPILSLTFLFGGIICGLIVVDKKSKVFVYIGKGALAMLPAVLLIALASSINLVMTESGILDTIMNTVISFLQGKDTFVCVIFIYLLILLLQIFIGSASAKIFLIMPILLPICNVIGISPNLLILIYCMADGFTDVIIPTNPVLLIGLSISNVSYGKWVKWTWKIQLIIFAITLLILFFAVQIGF